MVLEFLVGQMGFKLWIKTVKVLLLMNQELLLGLFNF